MGVSSHSTATLSKVRGQRMDLIRPRGKHMFSNPGVYLKENKPSVQKPLGSRGTREGGREPIVHFVVHHFSPYSYTYFWGYITFFVLVPYHLIH